MKIKKINLQLFFALSAILTLFILFSCDAKLTSPDDKDIPTNLQIEKVAEGRIKLSWDYTTTSTDTIEFDIYIKEGDDVFMTWPIGFPNDKNFFIDDIQTNDSLMYAYKILTHNISQDEYYFFSEQVAYFSENTTPTDLTIEQIDEGSIKIMWVENCTGEEGIYLDRKIGDGEWVNKYKALIANSDYCYDNDVILNEDIFYRVSVFYKSSTSGSTTDSIKPLFAAPSDINLVKLDIDKIQVSWINNAESDSVNFRIERKIGALEWNETYPSNLEPTIEVTDGSTSIIDDLSDLGLDCADIAYRVIAFVGMDESAYSEEVSIKIRLNLVGSFDTPGNAKDIYIQDYIGYIADYYDGLLILDLSNPTSPSEFSTLDLPDRTHSVYVKENKIYTLNQIGGFSIINADDITSPVIVDTCTIPGSLRDIYIYDYNGNPFYRYAYVSRSGNSVSILNLQGRPHFNETTPTIDTNGDARKVFVPNNDIYSNYAFVANGSNNGFAAIDITDPNNLNPNVNTYNSFDSYSSGQDIFVRGNHLFLANGERGLDIIDISVIDSPSPISTIETSGFVVGVYVFQDYVYIIDREIGLYVIDISDINYPFVLGSYELESEPSSINFLGSYIYLTDNEGIKIIQVVD